MEAWKMRSIKHILKITALCLALISMVNSISYAAETEKITLRDAISVEAPPASSNMFRSLNFQQAVDVALRNHPEIKAAQAKVNAAEGGIELSKTTYLPKLDLIWQSNRATRNNISGQLFSQSIIPSMTGPVIQDPSTGTAWGSAAGSLFTWEPFDFGYRKANVHLAKTQLGSASAEEKLSEFNIISSVGEAFFNALAAEESVHAEEAQIKRVNVFINTVQVLVNNGLRPGVDLTRAKAEFAVTQTKLLQAKANEAVLLARLAQAMGVSEETVYIQDDSFLQLSDQPGIIEPSIANHPELEVQKQNISIVQAREKSLSKVYHPKFNLQAAVFGRGSGVDPTGDLKGGAQGLVPTRANAAAGFTVTFPLLDYAAIQAQQKIESANEALEKAEYDVITQKLTGNLVQAKVGVETAKLIAQQTPIELDAAQTTEVQMKARYQAGLTTAVDIADAERLLTQSEIENSLAHLEVWHSFLKFAIAQGDLKPFMDMLDPNTQGGTK